MLLNVMLLRAEVNQLYKKVKEASGDSSDVDGKEGTGGECGVDAESQNNDVSLAQEKMMYRVHIELLGLL